MGFFDINESHTTAAAEKADDIHVVEIVLPGCEEWVPISKFQVKRIYEDTLGPRLLIIADECAELLTLTKTDKERDNLTKEILAHIQSITQLGRSSGIHCILCTQRNDTSILAGVVQNNPVSTKTVLDVMK